MALEPAAESGLNLRGRTVMTTKLCLKHELGLCPKTGAKQPAEPLALIDGEGAAAGTDVRLQEMCDGRDAGKGDAIKPVYIRR